MELGLSIRPIGIEEEMKRSYLDYAMSVIVSRALPDVRDGLKPVHRRILFAMQELGMRYNSPYKKSARIVGEVLGKYHPHGDSSVYDAMVRMAQDFSMRYRLVDGQGNFGSVDDDPPAAMRYTEARLARIADEMLLDIDKDTVDFMPNFDESLKEPSVLPARLPNLLINGSSGIAVGMATNIPPHNLTEVCDAIHFLIENPEASVDELMGFVKGPDFPTAGIICGVEGIKNAYAAGQGKVVLRARVVEESTKGGKMQLVVTELPYQTNKADLVKKIAELARDKKIEGISDVRDESDRQGMRLVIGLRKDAHPAKVQNNLFKFTSMQTAFFINMIALVDGQPRVINLKEALQCYMAFRTEVITRRTKFDLQKAKERAHILEGFKIALDHLDAVIKTYPRVGDRVKELQRCVNELDMAMVEIFSNVAGEPLDSERFLPFYKEIAHLNIPILVHPGRPVMMGHLREYGLAGAVGYLFDTTLAILRMVYSGLFDNLPDLKVIVPHTGSTIPYLVGRIDHQYQLLDANQRKLQHLPSEYLKKVYVDTAQSFYKPATECAFDFTSHDRILFGSDYPFVDLKQSVAIVKSLGLQRDSSGEAAAWPVEKSQSSSCSSMGPASQRSSKRALRASATWPRETPSENSKSAEAPGPLPSGRRKRRNARSISPRRFTISCVTTSKRAWGCSDSMRLHHKAHAASSEAGSAASKKSICAPASPEATSVHAPQASKSLRCVGRMRSNPAKSSGARVDESASSASISSSGRRAALARLPARQVSSKAASHVLHAAASCCHPLRALSFRNRGA